MLTNSRREKNNKFYRNVWLLTIKCFSFWNPHNFRRNAHFFFLFRRNENILLQPKFKRQWVEIRVFKLSICTQTRATLFRSKWRRTPLWCTSWYLCARICLRILSVIHMCNSWLINEHMCAPNTHTKAYISPMPLTLWLYYNPIVYKMRRI